MSGAVATALRAFFNFFYIFIRLLSACAAAYGYAYCTLRGFFARAVVLAAEQ